MPRLNGYETAMLLRQQPWANGIRLVALTGWGQNEDRTSSDMGDGPAVLGRHLGEYADAIHQYDQQEERAHSATEYLKVAR
jgi:CheY-like chemotaxis protein